MSVTHKMYGPFFENLMKGNIPDLTDAGTTVKCALMYKDGETSFSFDQDHDNWEDVMAFECDDADYTPGGEEITGKTITYASRVTTFDTTMTDSKIVFTSEGDITATHAVIYLDETADADSKLISCIDFGGERESVQGEFSITFDEDGIFKTTVAE